MQPEDFDSLNIATSDLRLEIDVDDSDEWSGLLVAFLNRVAELGHFERLSFSFRAPFHGMERDGIQPFLQALFNAVNANANLTYLDLLHV